MAFWHWFSNNSVAIIVALGLLHVLVWLGLRLRIGARMRRWNSQLHELVQRMPSGTSALAELSPKDSLDSYLDDVLFLLRSSQAEEHPRVSEKVNQICEAKPWKKGGWLETAYNVSRTFVEAYPLMGILGTVAAMGVALAQGPGGAGAGLAEIIDSFGDAIWSTAWGIIFGILLLCFHSTTDRAFETLPDVRKKFSELMHFRSGGTGSETP